MRILSQIFTVHQMPGCLVKHYYFNPLTQPSPAGEGYHFFQRQNWKKPAQLALTIKTQTKHSFSLREKAGMRVLKK